MKIKRRLGFIAVLILILNMVIATQYAVTKIQFEYAIVHPSNANIRYIGSDNTTGGRVLRINGDNNSGSLKLFFGNWSAGTNKLYSAAFGIINEEDVPVSISHINVSSNNNTYMKIWLHGNRTANANSTNNDPTSVLMYNNGTIVNASNTTAWTMAPGDDNPNTMCSNVSNRILYSSNTTWDNESHVRYSLNNTVGYSVNFQGKTQYNASDYVWVQIALDIPNYVPQNETGTHSGIIWIHLKADTTN